MMERLKTAALVMLVAASLVQSYFLAYSSPEFDKVTATDYVQTEMKGTKAELADLLYPEQMVLHFGNKTHTVLPVNNVFYKMIFDDFLKKRSFDGFGRTNLMTIDTDWNAVANDRTGIELRFNEGVPLSVLQNVLQIKNDIPVDAGALIKRILIYTDENGEKVKAFFFTGTSTVVYEAVKADLTAKDVEKFVALGTMMPLFHKGPGDYYVPDVPTRMVRYQMPYTQFTAEQLKRNLFVDPGLTRPLQERDGSQIYTDGKRGLQIRSGQRWISYSDPVYVPADSSGDGKDNLLSAIQFVNQHGGWNGSYVYSKTPEPGQQTFLFRHYMKGYPVINDGESKVGYIKVSLQKGVVSSYERSLMTLVEDRGTPTDESLIGGKELDDVLARYDRTPLRAVFPAYKAVVSDRYVDLIPRWAAELEDGTYIFLNE